MKQDIFSENIFTSGTIIKQISLIGQNNYFQIKKTFLYETTKQIAQVKTVGSLVQ